MGNMHVLLLGSIMGLLSLTACNQLIGVQKSKLSGANNVEIGGAFAPDGEAGLIPGGEEPVTPGSGAGSIPSEPTSGSGSTPNVPTSGSGSTPSVPTSGSGSTPSVPTSGSGSTPSVPTSGSGSTPSVPTSGSGSTPSVPTSGSGSTPSVPTSGSGSTPSVPTSGSGSTPSVPTSGSGSTPGLPTSGSGEVVVDAPVDPIGGGAEQEGDNVCAGAQVILNVHKVEFKGRTASGKTLKVAPIVVDRSVDLMRLGPGDLGAVSLEARAVVNSVDLVLNASGHELRSSTGAFLGTIDKVPSGRVKLAFQQGGFEVVAGVGYSIQVSLDRKLHLVANGSRCQLQPQIKAAVTLVAR